MKITKFFFLLITVLIISGLLAYFFYSYFVIESSYALDMKLRVDDHFGLSADSDLINFGRLMPGTSAERSILVNNNAAYPLRVAILKSGDIADWVTPSDNNFILNENESKQITFEVYAPEGSNFGNYTGKVRIIFKNFFLN